MADINHVITLGIGTPGDIDHFILDGLNAVAPVIYTGILEARIPSRFDTLDVSWRGHADARDRTSTVTVKRNGR